MDVALRTKTVNESGFPLQIAVSHFVDRQRPGGWRVRYEEHAWRDRRSGELRFIDVVLQNSAGTAFMVIECKSVRGAEWIFLSKSTVLRPREDCVLWVSRTRNSGWKECRVEPPSFQSAFCAVTGQDGSPPRSMLERVASNVVSATEALATQEKNFLAPAHDGFRVYVNAIVTTASLYVAEVDHTGVSLGEGTVDRAKFIEVPFVRFRKQLADSAADPITATTKPPLDVARARESTVFVVNAAHLGEFLQEFELERQDANRLISRSAGLVEEG